MSNNAIKLQKSHFQPSDSPWEGDKMSRKKVADYLTPIIGSIRQPFVIGISSPYGTGKTFFIQNWQATLKSDGYCTAYFNAWETDYADNPLIAFISAVKNDLENSADKTENKKAEKLVELAKKGGAYLTKKVVPVLAKGIVRKAVGDDGLSQLMDLSSATEDEIADLFGKMAEDALRQHEAVQSSIEGFKDYLGAFVKEATKDKDSEDKKKLIIFVDELDRCRPTYAIEVLECIKHLFNVEGVVFIVAVDEEQLRSSIAAVYGLRLDGEGYLKKFIDWRIRLPEPKSKEYANYLFDSFDLGSTGKFSENGDTFNGRQSLITVFSMLSEALGLTLRQQAHCFTDINISVRALEKNAGPLALVLGLVSVLREAYPNEIGDFCLGKKSVEALLERFDPIFESQPEIFRNFYGEWITFRAVIHMMFMDEEKFKQRISQEKALERELHSIIGEGQDSQDKDRERLQKEVRYIGALKTAYRHFSQGSILFAFSHAPAETVYMRLERASHLHVEDL